MFALRTSISFGNNRLLPLLASTRPLAPTLRMSSRAADSEPGPVEVSIQEKLTTLLRPSELSITNDSWQHRHHAAMRTQGGGNGETHFSVNVVSEAFEGKSTMQRHRMIYAALADELAQGLHALSLKTRTPNELQKAESS